MQVTNIGVYILGYFRVFHCPLGPKVVKLLTPFGFSQKSDRGGQSGKIWGM